MESLKQLKNIFVEKSKLGKSFSQIVDIIVTWANIADKPTEFPPEAHDHDDIYLNIANTTPFTPDADYEPATKKYVDDNGSGIDINSQTEKTTPVNDDIILIEDSEDTYSKKKVKFSNLPSSGSLGIWMPDVPPSSPSALDDEFNDSSFNTSLWSESDFTSKLSISEDSGGLVLTKQTEAANVICGCYQSIPAGDFTIIAKLFQPLRVAANYRISGIGLWEDAANNSKKMIVFSKTYSNSTTIFAIEAAYFNTYTSYNSHLSANNFDFNTSINYLRIRRISTTYSFEYSPDGLYWSPLYSGSIPFTPSHFGLMVNNANSGTDVIVRYLFFRYINSGNANNLLNGNRV